jgi:hypothetical protein
MLIIKYPHIIYIQASYFPFSITATKGNGELPTHNNGRKLIIPAIQYINGIITIFTLKHDLVTFLHS